MGKDLKGKELGEGISQRKDGKYIARYRNRQGQRPEKSFDDLHDARMWLEVSRFNDHCGKTVNMTVESWYQWFMAYIIKPSVRYNTYRRYETIYRLHVRDYIGELQMKEIKPFHIKNILVTESHRLKSSTVNGIRGFLYYMFDMAYDNEIIDRSPVRRSTRVRQTDKEERRVLTREEQEKLLKVAKDRTYYNDFAFALQTGLRVGELTGLKWSDVDLKKWTIRINRTTDVSNKEIIEGLPKSRCGIRTIPLTVEAYAILTDQLEKRKHSIINIKYADYVFVNRKGTLTTRSNYRRRLIKYAKEADIAPLSMHTLRHTFATRCVEAGMNPKSLQVIMGHSNINITLNLYTHVVGDTLNYEMEKVENFYSNMSEKPLSNFVGGEWAVKS